MVILNDLSKVPKFPRSGTCFFWQKSKMAATGHKQIVIYEEFNIYSLFRVFFLSFKALVMFCLQKSKMAAYTILKL